jgi:D-beta-D-heptose 7-phosphate kinase/D-beta-D-heptose 1-phosphate adenosyltransferase
MSAPLLYQNELGRICAMHHQQGIGIVLCTGCFDVLHAGHVQLLRQAAEYGPLFVGINTDEAIRQLKGPSRPINTLQNRAVVLSEMQSVKAVFPIDSTNVADAIRMVVPAFWIKGDSYTMETLNKEEVAAAREVGAEIVLMPMVEGISTTKILKQC